MDPAGRVENLRDQIGPLHAHLRVSHTSLDGHGPTTGSTSRKVSRITTPQLYFKWVHVRFLILR